MKLISYLRDGRPSFGSLQDDGVLDFGSRLAAASLREHLELGSPHPRGMADLRASDVTLLPPIVEPRKIMCIGLNYRSHALEAGHDIPKFPTVFFRMANAQVGHGAPLMRPHVSEQFDFEGELAVVIGKPGRNVSEAHAYEYVAGYTCFNDGSVRDWQRRASQWGPGKNFPASGACGPCLVTADEIADPPQLELITRLNGQIMQRANISDLIFGIPALIAYCSTFTELQVGDLIVTGTPGGVGGARNPPLWMTRGDLIEVSISGIGTLANRVADETPPATEV